MPTQLISLPPTLVHLTGYAWLQDIGAESFTDNQFVGTRGQSRRMEGFQIAFVEPPGTLNLQYRVQVENIGWMDWVDGGTYAGTKGQSLRCEAFEIALTGSGTDPLGYSAEYMAHEENAGDIGPFHDGQLCGSVGEGLRLEGMAVTIVNEYGQIQEA